MQRQMGAKTSGNFWHIILGHRHCGGVGAQRIEIIMKKINNEKKVKKVLTPNMILASTKLMNRLLIQTQKSKAVRLLFKKVEGNLAIRIIRFSQKNLMKFQKLKI